MPRLHKCVLPAWTYLKLPLSPLFPPRSFHKIEAEWEVDMGKARIDYAGMAAQVDVARQSAIEALHAAREACQETIPLEPDLKVAQSKLSSALKRAEAREWDFDQECFDLVDSAYGTVSLGRRQSELINNAVGAVAQAHLDSVGFRRDQAVQQRARKLAKDLGFKLRAFPHRSRSKPRPVHAGLYALLGNGEDTRYRSLDRVLVELIAVTDEWYG